MPPARLLARGDAHQRADDGLPAINEEAVVSFMDVIALQDERASSIFQFFRL
jgi:hypothetical protein